MIPVLYPSTQLTYTTNGIGRLVDAISCIVTEELNGIFELEMEYPVNGKYYPQIQNGGIIGVVYNGKLQPFDINKITVDETGICKVNASHVSNRTAFAWIGGGSNYQTLDQMIYRLNSSGQVPRYASRMPCRARFQAVESFLLGLVTMASRKPFMPSASSLWRLRFSP